VSKPKACSDLYDTLFPRQTQRFSNEPHSGQIGMFEIDSVVDQRIDISRQMEQSLHDLKTECDSVMRLLDGLKPDEFTVILRRYMQAESMEDIAEKMQLSVRHCWRLHGDAIWRMAKRVSDLQ
jgi:DNA-directed RNA polymerase specialized sigma24 family protein